MPALRPLNLKPKLETAVLAFFVAGSFPIRLPSSLDRRIDLLALLAHGLFAAVHPRAHLLARITATLCNEFAAFISSLQKVLAGFASRFRGIKNAYCCAQSQPC